MLISITDIIKQSVALYKNNAKRFVSYAFLLFIPGAFITMFNAVLPIIVPDYMHVGNLGMSYLIFIIIALIFSLINFLFTFTFIRIIAKSHTGYAVKPMWEEINDAKEIFLSALGAYFFTLLAIVGGMMLFIIPAIIFGVWFSLSVFIAATEHTPAFTSMQTSKQLIEGRWWAVALRLLIPSLIFAILVYIFTQIVATPLEYILENTNNSSLLYTTWSVLAALIISLFSSLLSPLITAVPLILYIDLKKNPIKKIVPPPTV